MMSAAHAKMIPTITLTTDFGTRDSYVAELKGVLLRHGPDALRIVDLSHELGAQDVREAAFFLRCALPRFPAGTIHLAIVDPGVGSMRRALIAEANRQFLVGPDNGIFGFVLGAGARVHAIETGGTRLASSTFHGRDLFAPAAARLACGEALASFGAPIRDPVRLPWPQPVAEGRCLVGEVVHVDRFGNLITNVERAALREGPVRVVLDGRAVGELRDHYAEVAVGELIALVGSQGLIEVAVREGSAAAVTGAHVGTRVHVESA